MEGVCKREKPAGTLCRSGVEGLGSKEIIVALGGSALVCSLYILKLFVQGEPDCLGRQVFSMDIFFLG